MSSSTLFLRYAPSATMLALGGAAVTPYDQAYGHPPGYGRAPCTGEGVNGLAERPAGAAKLNPKSRRVRQALRAKR